MSGAIEVLTITVSIACVFAVSIAIGLFAMNRFAAHVERIREAQAAVAGHKISTMGRWCCWHFPIIEDVEGYLLGDGERIEEFRARLIRKYGERKS